MTTHIGSGALNELPGLLRQLAVRNVFLVTGNKSFEQIQARFENLLQGFNTTRFFRDAPYPIDDDVKYGVKQFKEQSYDAIIAVGGGRVLDLAKLVRFFASVDTPIDDYLSGVACAPNQALPLVAIPTTAGSGSEATQFAVIYKDGRKHSVSHQSIKPDQVIIDADLSANLPGRITASCGMDALSQSIESFWSVRSSEESRLLSRAGIALALDNLQEAVHSGTTASREAMCRSAYLSGQAINLTTTTAPHAVSYPLTSIFGVPHGHAVALTLPAFFVFNSQLSEKDVADPRGVDFVRQSMNDLNSILSCSSASKSRDALRLLMQEIGLSSDLRSMGVVSQKEIARIVDMTNLERLSNNPRRISPEDLTKLLAELIGCEGDSR